MGYGWNPMMFANYDSVAAIVFILFAFIGILMEDDEYWGIWVVVVCGYIALRMILLFICGFFYF